MKKEEMIARYGKEAYEKNLEQNREWYKRHPERRQETNKEIKRKGGKYYEKCLLYNRTGLSGEINTIRKVHAKRWQKYKRIIAPKSQIHHQWIPQTAQYTGFALVEADQHMHGYIDVIEILDGEITIFTEDEIKKGY